MTFALTAAISDQLLTDLRRIALDTDPWLRGDIAPVPVVNVERPDGPDVVGAIIDELTVIYTAAAKVLCPEGPDLSFVDIEFLSRNSWLGPHTHPGNAHYGSVLTGTVMLNDPDTEYEGGALVVHGDTDAVFRAPAGTVVIFPSAMLHTVEPVTSGLRVSLVTRAATCKAGARSLANSRRRAYEFELMGLPGLPPDWKPTAHMAR